MSNPAFHSPSSSPWPFPLEWEAALILDHGRRSLEARSLGQVETSRPLIPLQASRKSSDTSSVQSMH